jgi:hypothetical protein
MVGEARLCIGKGLEGVANCFDTSIDPLMSE